MKDLKGPYLLPILKFHSLDLLKGHLVGRRETKIQEVQFMLIKGALQWTSLHPFELTQLIQTVNFLEMLQLAASLFLKLLFVTVFN